MLIRKMSRADLPALARMVVKIFREPYLKRVLLRLKDSFKKRVDGACLVAEDEGNISGAIICEKLLTTRPGTATVRDLFVEGKYRGKGIGNEMMAASLAAMKKKGITSVSLTVNEKNKRARSLYKKAGFKPFRLMLLRRF